MLANAISFLIGNGEEGFIEATIGGHQGVSEVVKEALEKLAQVTSIPVKVIESGEESWGIGAEDFVQGLVDLPGGGESQPRGWSRPEKVYFLPF